MLGVVRLYYKYLIENGRATENPATGLYVKGRIRRLPHDLAEREELEAMYHAYKTKTLKDKRDKVLLKIRKRQNEIRQLFFGSEGALKLGNTVKRIMRKLRGQHPKHAKLTSRKIRESVIVYWLKTKDIRTVQYLAGHRYVSSTERYKKLDMEHLKEQVNELHPLRLEKHN
jgi:integrase/recombinase XerD